MESHMYDPEQGFEKWWQKTSKALESEREYERLLRPGIVAVSIERIARDAWNNGYSCGRVTMADDAIQAYLSSLPESEES